MPKTILQDSHAHIYNIAAAEKLKTDQRVGRIFFNALSSKEDKLIQDLQISNDNVIPFLGIHPWMVSSDSEKNNQELETLNNFIGSILPLGIGECGLDFSPRYKSTKTEQIYILKKQLEIAKKSSLAVSIHCVKAWDELLTILKDFSPLKIIIHSFYANEKIAKQLDIMGAYFSISKRSLCNLEKSVDIIKNIPKNKILIESDCFLGDNNSLAENHFNQLYENYQMTAQILSINLNDFIERVFKNGTIFQN